MRRFVSPRAVAVHGTGRLGQVLLVGTWLLLGLRPALLGQEPRPLAVVLDDDRVAEGLAAVEEAIGKGEEEQAVFLAQRLLEADLDRGPGGDGFLERHLLAAPGDRGLHLASYYLVARRLASAPPDFAARYREMTDGRAELAVAREAALGPRAALAAARRFPLATAGLRAMERAGHSALESGEPELAARLFGDLLDLDWRAAEDRQAARRAALVISLAETGDPASLLPAEFEGAALIGGERRPARELAEEERARLLARARDPFPDGRPTRLEEVWERTLPGWEVAGGEALLPAPLESGELLVFHDRGGVEAIRTMTGALAWERPFTAEGEDALGEMDDPDLLALRGALAGDRYLFVHAALDDEGRIRRRLVAVAVADGREIWRFEPTGEGSALPELLLDPNILVAGELLFVTAFDRAATPACHVLRIDPENGRLLAATRLPAGVPLAFLDAEGELRPARHWLSALPMRMVQGFLLAADGLGHLAALQADDLEPRFLYRYERPLVSGPQARRHRLNPVLAAGSRIVAAPADAAGALALFLRPPADPRRRGENLLCQLASTLIGTQDETLLAFDGRRLVTAGRDRGERLEVVRARRAFVDASPEELFSAPLDSPVLGEGFFDQKDVYLCTHKYVYATDLSEGAVFGPLHAREADGDERLGSLSAAQVGLIVASRRGIRAYRAVP